jgi:hypothetical protein
VRDEGVGMTSEELARIFNLYEQADTSIARTRGGLGIGLTLVRRIVELHGGSVSATSTGLSQGSEFVVRLPLSERAAAPAGPGAFSGRQAARQSGRRILVVDDNVDAALSVERLLKQWGHEVQTVFNGPEALEKARAFRPHLVLLDIGMPGMSGYEVARHLRAQREFEGMVITPVSQPRGIEAN